MKHELIIILFIIMMMSGIGSAHEPLFGIGPHTLYKYGFAIESELAREGDNSSLQWELAYGLTADWTVTAEIPQLNLTGTSGLGDVLLRTKYRFYRKDEPGASNQAALAFGIKLPTGKKSAALGSGSTDILTGLTVARESRRWYYFGDVRYRINTKDGNLKHGNVFKYDVAWGVRPVQTTYLQPDLVILIELNGTLIAKSEIGEQEFGDSGGNILAVAPGFLLSYRNIMFKGGIKFPVAVNLNGNQDTPDPELVLGFEFHL